MTSLYIYYKVQPSLAEPLSHAIAAMQASLRSGMPGLAVALWCRSDEPTAPGLQTWMETYHFNGHADARAWQALEAAMAPLLAALPPGIEGPRHHERFELMTPRPAGYGGTPCV